VGNNSWYKNRDGVLRIFAKACELAPAARPRLLIIGREFTRKQKDMIAQLGLEADVRRMADASSQQLQAAYSVADVFLFPSLYEGFGWPPIEAQACGCPVVAGAGGSLAEVLGDSALTADAKDETRLAGFVARVLQEPALCEDLRARGLGNVARFRAPRMIDDYVALYERILAESLS
jgi:glycosyltransferase involved in cell wall biosynthesis